MQIGTRLRYGLNAVLDLARRGGSDPIRAVDIANAAGISKGYLEGLLAALRRAGLVRAVRGPGGGWHLTRPPSQIRPTQIYAVLEGPTALVKCIEWPESCEHSRGCASRRLWTRMSKSLEKSLKEETIAQLAGLVKKRAPAKKKTTTKKRAKKKTTKAKAAKKKTTGKKTAKKKVAKRGTAPKRKTAAKKTKTRTRVKARSRVVKPAKMRVVKKKPSARTKKVVRAPKRLKRSA